MAIQTWLQSRGQLSLEGLSPVHCETCYKPWVDSTIDYKKLFTRTSFRTTLFTCRRWISSCSRSSISSRFSCCPTTWQRREVAKSISRVISPRVLRLSKLKLSKGKKGNDNYSVSKYLRVLSV